MDFEDTLEEAEFRHEVRAWLEEQAAEYDLSNQGQLTHEQQLALGRAFQARKADRGYAKVTWPRELGGMGGTPMQAVIYDQEEEKYDFPTVFFAISVGMPIPVMRRFATDEQKQRYLVPALRGEEYGDSSFLSRRRALTWAVFVFGLFAKVMIGCSTARRSGHPGPISPISG